MTFSREQARLLLAKMSADEQDEVLRQCRLSPQMEACLIYTPYNGYTRIEATKIVFNLANADYIHIDNYEERFKRLRSKAESRLCDILNGKNNAEYTKLFKKYVTAKDLT